jgi:hypothetical protein
MTNFVLFLFVSYVTSLISITVATTASLVTFPAVLLGIALLGLYGYLTYLDNKKQPDIRAEVEKAFEERDKIIKDLRNSISKYEIATGNVKNFKF